DAKDGVAPSERSARRNGRARRRSTLHFAARCDEVLVISPLERLNRNFLCWIGADGLHPARLHALLDRLDVVEILLEEVADALEALHCRIEFGFDGRGCVRRAAFQPPDVKNSRIRVVAVGTRAI